MGYDVRNFIDDLEKEGELIEINDEVDWNLEIPAYSVISGRFGGPAFLFNNVKGVAKGHRLLTGMFAGTRRKPHKRVAIALGIDPSMDIIPWYQELAKRATSMLRPVEVATGPCKEVIKMGKDANLLEFPFTYHSQADGGRYCLTNATIIKDPDSDWVNMGNYSIGISSRNRVVIHADAHTNFVAIYTGKYEARNQSMPIAIALGGDPAVNIAAFLVMPPGVTEYDVSGGMRGRPIELVKAETSDLLVPADAEIIIEGEMRPYERLPEGPKIECFAFSAGPRLPYYAMRVHCITHRKDPILWDMHTAIGADADCIMKAIARLGALSLYKMLGLPIKFGTQLCMVEAGGTSQHALIKKKYPEDYPGFMQDIIDKVTGAPGLNPLWTLSFCDDDVNVTNSSEWYDAMFTQLNPARDLIRSAPMMMPTIEAPWLESWDRVYMSPATVRSQRMIYDFTTKEEPPQGVRRLSFETLFPEKLQQWVVDNWERLGFKGEAQWNKGYLEARF